MIIKLMIVEEGLKRGDEMFVQRNMHSLTMYLLLVQLSLITIGNEVNLFDKRKIFSIISLSHAHQKLFLIKFKSIKNA